MNLSDVKSTRRIVAPRVVVVGADKVGKSTLAASAPNPVGILTEDGSFSLDLQAFPICKTLEDFYSCVKALRTEEHSFESVVVDSLDWLEPMVWSHVCTKNDWSSIEEPGYGKGYAMALSAWRTVFRALDALRDKGMNVIVICHDKVKRIETPLISDGYDRFSLKLNDKAAALVAEWADIIGYMDFKTLISKDGDKVRAVRTGERLLRVAAHVGHCGGNRFGMKDFKVPAVGGWSALVAAMQQATTIGE